MEVNMNKIVLGVICMVLFLCGQVFAELTADEIAAKAYHAAYYQGKDGRSRAVMTATDSRSRTRERALTILRFNIKDGADQKYFVYFQKPNDVKGMTYIVWKHAGKDDDRWLYLPALDLVRRVAASDKRSSFAGTNFLYEDISGRSVDLDKHELISGDDKSYAIKNTPKDPEGVEFSYYTVFTDKQNFIPMKADYFDKDGGLYRTVEALEIKDIQGYPTITRMKASDMNAGSSTITEFTSIEYDIDLSEEIFTERYLRNPPVQWIKE